MLRNWRFLAGSAIVTTVVMMAVVGPILMSYEPNKSSVFLLQAPSQQHWLGTDELGRDILSRLIYGSRTTLVIGIGAAFVALLIGAPIGLTAGYFRGGIDLVIVPVIDLFVSLPALILALIITVMVGPSYKNLILVLGFVMWPTMARLVRGQALIVREATFIEAAVAAGGTSAWIIRRHVWPNIMRVVAAQFAVAVSLATITAASLSFLGLGIPPPTADWGGMVRSGFEFLALNPAMSLAPGAATAITVMGFYLGGSAIE
jgi:peptide/nickel transport system permease protein